MHETKGGWKKKEALQWVELNGWIATVEGWTDEGTDGRMLFQERHISNCASKQWLFSHAARTTNCVVEFNLAGNNCKLITTNYRYDY